MRVNGWDKRIAAIATTIVLILVIATPIFVYGKKYLKISQNIASIELPQIEDTASKADDSIAAAPVVPETKEAIQQTPPKHIEPSKTTSSTKTNSDGTKTTTLSEGGISSSETLKIAALTPVGLSPYDVRFSDETSQNATLEKVLKDYLNSSLKWSNEISNLYQITIRDAGDTGWSGQYAGSYTINQSGEIVSAYGYIVLNTYYYKDNSLFNDYMKLVLSHEYGHHYSLYHKWIDLNLPNGIRFPEAYYTARGLSKNTTATDYSLGWGNCEAEIVAEDYSYLYSGYGHHAMAATYGYPNSAVKSWFESLAVSKTATDSNQTVTDNPPSVTIIKPATGTKLSGTVDFAADATDDIGVNRVDFYIDDTKIGSDSESPYLVSFATSKYSNGGHTLKAIVYDLSQSSTASVTVDFDNAVIDTTPPIVKISSPNADPYLWSDTKDLVISLSASDDIGVTTIKLYVDDVLVGESKYSSLRVTWPAKDVSPGSHIFRAEAYDAALNVGSATLTVNKS